MQSLNKAKLFRIKATADGIDQHYVASFPSIQIFELKGNTPVYLASTFLVKSKYSNRLSKGTNTKK